MKITSNRAKQTGLGDNHPTTILTRIHPQLIKLIERKYVHRGDADGILRSVTGAIGGAMLYAGHEYGTFTIDGEVTEMGSLFGKIKAESCGTTIFIFEKP